MKKKINILVILGWLMISHKVFAQEIDFSELEKYINHEMTANQIPGLAIGVVKEGKIIYSKGFGITNAEGNPVTIDSPFVLASLTKSFTALAIMQLEAKGRLSGHDKVTDHLPFFRLKHTDYTDAITINHLLNHTSGIPRISSYKVNQKNLSLKEKVERLQDVEGTGKFNQFNYANDNYAILGLIIEATSQRSYENYIREHILSPLNMSSTFFNQEEAAAHNMARGHQLYFGFPVESGITYHRANIANGAMISSANNMCQYLLSLMSNDSISGNVLLTHQQKKQLFETPPADIYAKGWFINNRNGKKFLSHGGILSDYRNFIGFYPEEQLGFVVLINQNSLFLKNRIAQISENMLRFINGEETVNTSEQKLNMTYWIFISVSLVLGILLVVSIIRQLRSEKIYQLTSTELRKKKSSVLIHNILIPAVMIGWFWYMGNYLMISLHKSQPDMMIFFQAIFIHGILSGLISLYKIKQHPTVNKKL
ncbi:serine hydrolase domain-containing protein [Fulvivirgaceae bacterium BMA12]|uniref:Serine hydrolase domain-containing protein n=1 Tax=Agaribacillus aureus TaxID=3051825 RepID=A0ABT8L1V8_9BACT|nr:serine hydrolase domain-containing protein [Fulvivirgaceae bacterium BMA12]